MNFRSMIPFVARDVARGPDSFSSLQREINRAFDDIWRGGVPSTMSPRSVLGWAPSVDVKDETARLLVTAELPGVDEKDVDLTLDGDVLTISGEKKLEREDKDEKGEWFMSERSYGSFSRSFTLPFTPGAGAVEAEYRKGVLHVTIQKPRAEEAKTRSIPIKSN